MFLDRLHQARGLTEGRVTLHWGAQIVAAVGHTLRPPQPDFSHTALEVRDARLTTRVEGVEVALDAAGVLQIRREGDARTLPLVGLTVRQALVELAQGLRLFGLDVEALHRPEHPMPPHPVELGEPFASFPVEAIEVLRWLQTGRDLLGEILGNDFGPARLWPHHFDVARSWTVTGAGGEAKTVTAGLSPGDEHEDEPYFYVAPWPPPNDALPLPPLSAGVWRREGWTGAALLGSTLLEAEDRQGLCADFLKTAVAASAALLRS